MRRHCPALTLLTALILSPAIATGQGRDLRAERLVLDDNHGNTITIQTPSPPNVPLGGNYVLRLPEPSATTTQFLLTDPPSGTTAQTVNGSLHVQDTLQADRVEASLLNSSPGENLRLGSTGSVVIGIDEDDDGTGSSFAIEANALANPDLFRVTETGLTDINSSSGTGGLRVNNAASSGSANILELRDGTSTRFRVQRNGNATLDGELNAGGNIATGAFIVLGQEEQTSLNDGITLTPGSSHILVGGNGGAVSLSGTTAITNGTVVGQILIMIGSDDANSVTLNDGANVQLSAATRTLGLDDTLTLLWNGSDWIETGYADN